MSASSLTSATMKSGKGKFAGDVLKLTLGSVSAQVLSVASAPFLTRLFGPEAFGLAMVFTSLTGVVGVAICLRYDRSIIVPKSDEDAIYLIEGSVLAALAFTVISALFVLLARSAVARWLNARELAGYLWLLPVYIFFFGTLAALNTWVTRKKRFLLLVIVQFVSVVCYLSTSLIFGFTGRRSGGT